MNIKGTLVKNTKNRLLQKEFKNEINPTVRNAKKIKIVSVDNKLDS